MRKNMQMTEREDAKVTFKQQQQQDELTNIDTQYVQAAQRAVQQCILQLKCIYHLQQLAGEACLVLAN